VPDEGVRVTDTGINEGGNCYRMVRVIHWPLGDENEPEEVDAGNTAQIFVTGEVLAASGLDSKSSLTAG
jgi:hypothetical protein